MMKYISYYDTPSNKEQNRGYVLAATNKMDYICSVINEIGKDVEIVSASTTLNSKPCKGKVINLTSSVKLKLFSCLGRGSKLKNFAGVLLSRVQMFVYLMKTTKKGEKIICYHSLGYMGLIKLLKKLKKVHLILEVEEIYADVIGNKQCKKKEMNFFELADAYIFPTTLLNDLVNTENKPHVIIHGTYKVEEDRNVSFGDDKIHVVYAGTFDPRKGGADAAGAAKFLSPNYHIHILGFGNAKDTEYIKTVIENSNVEGKGIVTFDGLLSGEDYIRFIQKCHIGLSTQSPDAAFNSTSFPSKVLSYMSNGLRVVSIKIPAIENSFVGNDLKYYEKQTSEEIAKAVASINVKDQYDSRKKIEILDAMFRKELEELL